MFRSFLLEVAFTARLGWSASRVQMYRADVAERMQYWWEYWKQVSMWLALPACAVCICSMRRNITQREIRPHSDMQTTSVQNCKQWPLNFPARGRPRMVSTGGLDHQHRAEVAVNRVMSTSIVNATNRITNLTRLKAMQLAGRQLKTYVVYS